MKQPLVAVSVRTILALELDAFFRSQVVREFVIAQTSNGLYQLRVFVTFEAGEFTVADSRGKPREWTRLDTLAPHIRRKFGASHRITLLLRDALPSQELAEAPGEVPSMSSVPGQQLSPPAVWTGKQPIKRFLQGH